MFQLDQNALCQLLLLVLSWEFFTSVRTARKLKYQHYVYCESKTLNNGNFYRECSEQRSGNEWNVELVFDESKNILNQSGEHSHPPNPNQVQAEIIHSHIKWNFINRYKSCSFNKFRNCRRGSDSWPRKNEKDLIETLQSDSTMPFRTHLIK